jgi:uncharacterized protein (DUF58 family)
MNLNKNIFALAKQIEIKAKKALYTSHSGAKKSPFKGSGMQFKEFRNYTAGDDIRYMSWNVTARTQKPTLKVFEEEKDFYIYLFIDVSGSMLGGFESPLKKQALESAAVIILSAISQGNKVGLCLFSDKIEKIISPERKPSTCIKYLSELLKINFKEKKSDFKPVLNQALMRIKKRSLCFFLSDFNFPIEEKLLQPFARHHEIIFLHFAQNKNHRLYETYDAENKTFGIYDSKNLETPPLLLNQLKKLKHKGTLDFTTLNETDSLHSLSRFFNKRNF